MTTTTTASNYDDDHYDDDEFFTLSTIQGANNKCMKIIAHSTE